jgi:hypothetical protein
MTAQQRNRAIVILLLILVILALFWTYSAHAQVHDVPSVPEMAVMGEHEMVYLAVGDSTAYVEWLIDGEIVRTLYLEGYGEPLYWIGAGVFNFPGLWDALFIPTSPARLQDRALFTTYWQVKYILDEAKATLPQQPLTYYEPEEPP